MLCHDMYRGALIDAELMQPLLSALRSSDNDAKTSAMTTLAALTVTEAGRAQLRAANGLAVLLDVLLSTSSEVLQEATCQVLANLCEDQTDEWRQLVQNGAIFSLVPMLGSRNVTLQESALTLLALLCAHPEVRDQVADSGCTPTLGMLLGSAKSEVQRSALALCQQLCASRRACDSLLDAGAAAPLAAMLVSSNISNAEVVSAVLECLQSLTNSGLTQSQQAVRNVGAVPYLIQLMTHESPRISQTAASLVSSLCPGDARNADQLFESGGLVMLAEHLDSGDERAQLQAVSALSQLSADTQQAKAIVGNGCLTPLLELLEHHNQELKSYAAITFGNLCNLGAIEPSQLQHPTVLPHLVSMLSSSNGLAKGPAAAAIASMASQPQLRQNLFELGGLPGLTALLQSDAETSYHAVQAVAQFAADERFRAFLPEAGACAPLTSLLFSSLPHVQQCALSAIANTSFVPSAVAPLCANDALAQVGQLLFSHDESVQKMCLTTLCNLLGGDASSSEKLLQVGGHMALLTQLSSPSPETQSQAAMCIGHMGRHRPAVQALLQADTIPLLAQLLHSPHPAVQLQTVYALGVLAADDEAAASAVQLSGAIAPLTTLLLSSSSVDVKQHLSLTLAHVVRGNWQPVFNVGGFQALLDVLSVGTDAILRDVSSSLAVLLDDVHQRRALLADMNSVSAIVGLLNSSNDATQQNAAAALAALSQESSAREVLYRLGTLSHIIRSLTASNLRQDGQQDSGVSAARVSMVQVVASFAADSRYSTMLRITIQPLVAMLTGDNEKALVHAAHAVTSLSHSESNRDALRDAGALRRMAELLLHSDESVQQSAVQCVANLGVDASDAKAFMASGWHLSLISLLSAASTEVQGAAAAVLGNLSSAPKFRETLMADGALQPILQLLHAPALPTRTAAIRALAIISQQLMSPVLPRDDPSCKQFVEALFDANSLSQLLEVLNSKTSPAADASPMPNAAEASAATAQRQVVAVLLLLQNLSGGHGQVRSRLAQGGAVASLIHFLTSRSGGGVSSDSEILDSAASTLANLMLTSAGYAKLNEAGGVPVLVDLLRSGRAELCSPLSRALGNLARGVVAPALVDSALPAMLQLVVKTTPAVADILWFLTNLFSLRRDAFSAACLQQLAAGLVLAVGTEARHAAVALAAQMALHEDGRHALCTAGMDESLRKSGMPGLELLLGMLSTDEAAVVNGDAQPAQMNAASAPLVQQPPPPPYFESPPAHLQQQRPPQPSAQHFVPSAAHVPEQPPPPPPYFESPSAHLQQQQPAQPSAQQFVPTVAHTPEQLTPPQPLPLLQQQQQQQQQPMAYIPPPMHQQPQMHMSPSVQCAPPPVNYASTMPMQTHAPQQQYVQQQPSTGLEKWHMNQRR